MNHDFLIKTTNKVAFWSVIALFYWIFIFIVITVFDLKIFRENITETFLMSVMAIFALLGGALVLNIMSNLSKISASVVAQSDAPKSVSTKKWWLLSFPIILALLVVGNALSAHNKEKMLVNAAESLIAQNPKYNQLFANYSFDETYIKNTALALEVIQKIDKFFPSVMVIQQDEIDGKPVFLKFNEYFSDSEEQPKTLTKQSHIFTTGSIERKYLAQVFQRKSDKHLFVSDKGRYELFYPVTVSDKRYVMYFSDYQRYGKIGS